jgi:Type II secretion system (T2SS), protein G
MRFFIIAGLALILPGSAPIPAKADLNPKQARKLISHMLGFELSNSAVRVKQIEGQGSSVEASADIEVAFRFSKYRHDSWEVVDVRTGPNRWEQIDTVLEAIQVDKRKAECDPPESFVIKRDGNEPSVKRAKCLMVSLLGVDPDLGAVRIKEINPLNLPFSGPSAVVLAVVQADVRLVNEPGGWRVSELRVGHGEWTNLQLVKDKVDQKKSEKARADLELIAKALGKLHADRGFYIASDKQGVLMDFLSPTYLPRILRIDPWHRPYLYRGGPNQFKLRSAGPDGKEDTADDIVVSGPSL